MLTIEINNYLTFFTDFDDNVKQNVDGALTSVIALQNGSLNNLRKGTRKQKAGGGGGGTWKKRKNEKMPK